MAGGGTGGGGHGGARQDAVGLYAAVRALLTSTPGTAAPAVARQARVLVPHTRVERGHRA